MKASLIDDISLAIWSAIKSAVAYPVFDGPPSKLPDRGSAQYLVIGAETLDDIQQMTPAADMTQEWIGLGEKARREELVIHCVAVARSRTIAGARAIGMAMIQDADSHIPLHPTPESFNALINGVTALRAANMPGGAIVHVEFTISASARLV